MPSPSSPGIRPPLSGNVRGIAWMLLTGVLFVAVTVTVGLVIILPMLSRAGILNLSWKRVGFHGLRGLIHGGGVMLWFLAMSRIPIAEVTALGFTTPIFATLGAALFLNERFRSDRLVVILVGFLGALLILRPGFRVIDIGAFAQLAAAPLFACSYLMVKSATQKESSAMIVVLLSVFCTLTLA
ncbi:MAG: EamA/RhaT family transporter, partial [Gammaproteobacteria bacterium]|nr:EamA/RhaT family transporter [Gammaproteobacteria bacterium]